MALPSGRICHTAPRIDERKQSDCPATLLTSSRYQARAYLQDRFVDARQHLPRALDELHRLLAAVIEHLLVRH